MMYCVLLVRYGDSVDDCVLQVRYVDSVDVCVLLVRYVGINGVGACVLLMVESKYLLLFDCVVGEV